MDEFINTYIEMYIGGGLRTTARVSCMLYTHFTIPIPTNQSPMFLNVFSVFSYFSVVVIEHYEQVNL